MATIRQTPKQTNGIAWGYVRYSTAKQGENSAERQCQALERWAKRTGVELVAVAYDPAVSRTTDHGERPGLTAALDGLHGSGAALVAETVSRFAGDGYILETIRRQLGKSGARLATADETGNADLDEDRQDFEAMFSKREIKQIRARTKGALAVKKMRGERVGGIPYGKRLAADGVHLETDDAEQAVIARAKALSDTGLSVRAIATALAAEGIVGRTCNALSHTQVHRFLRPLLVAEAA
jgi:DNA invertase Pin-like site-specific DNA recombinase